MQRFIKSFVLAVFVFILSGVPLQAEAQSTRPSAEEILVLLSSDTSIYAEGLSGIQSEVNRPLRITYVDTLLTDEVDVADFFARHEDQKPPLVITIGGSATRLALQHLKKTPVLFSMVNSARSFINQSQGSCGVSAAISMQQYFRTLKEIQPNARTVYIFYSTKKGEFVAREADYMDLQNGLLAYRKRIDSKQELGEALQEIKGKADAFYMIPDPLYDRSRFEELSRFCKNHGILLMTSYASLVRSGSVFAITPNYSQIGTLTGAMADRILSGNSTCEQEGVQFGRETFFYLNKKYADQSQIQIPKSVEQRARQTRLFNAGIKLYNDQKLKSARIVFDAILKKDPQNEAALEYKHLVVNKLTGDQTRQLLQQARSKRARHQYAAALHLYQRVLQINPVHLKARKEMEDTREAMSQTESRHAAALAGRGQPFDAIRAYQNALQSWPGNQQARQGLAALQGQQKARIPSLLKVGVQYYNRRQYNRAIQIFQNILLVAPAHKQAQEYLRLSRKKKAALENLIGQ